MEKYSGRVRRTAKVRRWTRKRDESECVLEGVTSVGWVKYEECKRMEGQGSFKD